MKTIIAGCRDCHCYVTLLCAVDNCGFEITSVVSGGAQGVDLMGEQFAKNRGLPVERHRAEWGKHGKAAGPMRNHLMASRAEALVAIWDGKSRGTKNMIDEARKRNLVVYVHHVSP
jgi:hypothetical protein